MGSKAKTPNWKKIKAEYIKGGISQQKLADKYGIGVSTLKRRAKVEGWTNARAECDTKTGLKMVQIIADQQADYYSKMQDIFDQSGLAAVKKLLQQINDFPEGASTTKVTRESVKIQEIDKKDGTPPEKIPIKSFIESDLSETIKNLSVIGKSFGLDAASKLAAKKAQFLSGEIDPQDDGGFIQAMDEARPDEWDIADVPLNITDTEDTEGDGE